jgi:hypothetical protein
MNFNLVSKNNLGAVGALMLVILLTQARTFNFLVDTILGRFALIIMLILISYANKIFGVVSVLLIVVLFNVSDIGYLEGFDGNKGNENKDENVNKDENEKKIDTLENNKLSENNTDENDTNMKKKINVITNSQDNSSQNKIETTIQTQQETTATEGFNILGMENDFKRGKNSNTIPVSSLMNSSDSVLPYDPNSISENFSTLF